MLYDMKSETHLTRFPRYFAHIESRFWATVSVVGAFLMGFSHVTNESIVSILCMPKVARPAANLMMGCCIDMAYGIMHKLMNYPDPPISS